MPYFYAIFTIYLINLEKIYIFMKPVFYYRVYIFIQKSLYVYKNIKHFKLRATYFYFLNSIPRNEYQSVMIINPYRFIDSLAAFGLN